MAPDRAAQSGALVDDLEAVFLNNRVGENFFGDALELLMGLVTVPAIQIEHEKFSLTDVFDGGEAQAGEGVVDSLALRIEHGALWHDPDVSFHGAKYNIGKALA
jgi:hypothetical protein